MSDPASDETSSGIDMAIEERLVEVGDLWPSLLGDWIGGGKTVLGVLVTGGWAGFLVGEVLWSFGMIGLVELERLETGVFLMGVLAVPAPKRRSPDEDEDVNDMGLRKPSAEFVRDEGTFCRADGTGLVVLGAALRLTTVVRPLTEVVGLKLFVLALTLEVLLGCAVPVWPLSFFFAVPDWTSDIGSMASLAALSIP